MICADCKQSYRSEPGEIAASGTLAGLCESCGTEPRYARFARSYGRSLLAVVISLEVLLIVFIAYNWWGFASLFGMALLAWLLVRVIAHKSEPVRYRSDKERKRATRAHRFAGSVAGLATGIALFMSFFNALTRQ